MAAHRAMLDHLIAVESLVMGAHREQGRTPVGRKKKSQ
jgi:hypothetical protein